MSDQWGGSTAGATWHSIFAENARLFPTAIQKQLTNENLNVLGFTGTVEIVLSPISDLSYLMVATVGDYSGEQISPVGRGSA